jgi:hypothetical protein
MSESALCPAWRRLVLSVDKRLGCVTEESALEEKPACLNATIAAGIAFAIVGLPLLLTKLSQARLVILRRQGWSPSRLTPCRNDDGRD